MAGYLSSLGTEVVEITPAFVHGGETSKELPGVWRGSEHEDPRAADRSPLEVIAGNVSLAANTGRDCTRCVQLSL